MSCNIRWGTFVLLVCRQSAVSNLPGLFCSAHSACSCALVSRPRTRQGPHNPCRSLGSTRLQLTTAVTARRGCPRNRPGSSRTSRDRPRADMSTNIFAGYAGYAMHASLLTGYAGFTTLQASLCDVNSPNISQQAFAGFNPCNCFTTAHRLRRLQALQASLCDVDGLRVHPSSRNTHLPVCAVCFRTFLCGFDVHPPQRCLGLITRKLVHLAPGWRRISQEVVLVQTKGGVNNRHTWRRISQEVTESPPKHACNNI
jgi:hypothetical protein